METCLAMTIFRDEFNVEFVAMFVILTFVKVLHWLVQDRVDYIETTPTISRLHHLRIISFMNLLLVSCFCKIVQACFVHHMRSEASVKDSSVILQGVDSLFLQFTISKTLERSASVHLLFAFEYVIQCSIIVSTFIKYLLSAFDAYMEGRWENKVSIGCSSTVGSAIVLYQFSNMCILLSTASSMNAGGLCVLSATLDRYVTSLRLPGLLCHCLHQLWASPPFGMPELH